MKKQKALSIKIASRFEKELVYIRVPYFRALALLLRLLFCAMCGLSVFVGDRISETRKTGELVLFFAMSGQGARKRKGDEDEAETSDDTSEENV